MAVPDLVLAEAESSTPLSELQNARDPKKEMQAKHEEVKSLLSKITAQAAKLASTEGAHWGHAGSMAEVHSQLSGLHSFLGGN